MKFIDLTNQYKLIKKQIDKNIISVIKGGNFILGENVDNFEKAISKFTESKYSVGVNSGTDAIFLSLKALEISKGDEVITTPFTFFATAETIANTGAKPVFVDINPNTYNIDASKIEKAITKKTKAIMPVHLYGQMANMKKITQIANSKGLYIIEDAAQALGAKMRMANGKWQMAGSVGITGCFSFFPTKNLGAFGDAGMITTNDEKLAEKIKMLRSPGSRKKYNHEIIGVNSRLDELQAAILNVKFPYLRKWNDLRRKIAHAYTKNLSSVKQIKTPFVADNNYHTFHQYTIRTKHRDELKEYLEKNGIPVAIHYSLPLHLQPAFKYLGYKKGDFLEAEKAADEVLSLPIYPEMDKKNQMEVVDKIKNFFKVI